jgi:hypothetical protein
MNAPVICQHPLAYLLGLEGIALLRAFSGVYDRDFTTDRLREIRTPLDSVDESGEGEEAPEHVPSAPPDIWASHPWCIAATNAAYRGSPIALILHFQLDET